MQKKELIKTGFELFEEVNFLNLNEYKVLADSWFKDVINFTQTHITNTKLLYKVKEDLIMASGYEYKPILSKSCGRILTTFSDDINQKVADFKKKINLIINILNKI